MEEQEFYHRFLTLFREENLDAALRMAGNLPKLTRDLEAIFLGYQSFKNSLIDHLPESSIRAEKKILLVGGETDAENMAVHQVFPSSEVYVLNPTTAIRVRLSGKLSKRLDGILGQPFEGDQEKYDAIILHHLDHVNLVNTQTENPRYQEVNQKALCIHT